VTTTRRTTTPQVPAAFNVLRTQLEADGVFVMAVGATGDRSAAFFVDRDGKQPGFGQVPSVIDGWDAQVIPLPRPLAY
jgi:hypothetical protein